MRDRDRKTRHTWEEWDEAPSRRWSWWRWLLVLSSFSIVIAGVLALVTGLVVYHKLAAGLPDVKELETYQPSLGTEVYDRDEKLIAEFFIERRRLVPLEDVPLYVRQATLAAEDSRFYQHRGVDLVGVLRAVWVNLRAGETKEGASTITQQVARNLFLTRERTLSRKLREAILARRIEKYYGKERILQIYLNQIFYGHNAYGIEAAAQLYFGKSVKDLTLAEGALIAGLPPAPNTYSPLKNPQLSLKRRSHVLRRMVEEGYLTAAQAEVAQQESLDINTTQPAKQLRKAPYFIEYVRQYLEEKYGPNELYRGGFAVHTTLDIRLQAMADQALKDGLLVIDKRTQQGVYQGPMRHLTLTDDEAANKAMIEAVTVPDDGDTAVAENALLPGVVLQTTDAAVIVQVKTTRGRMPASGFAWVRAVKGFEGKRRPKPAQFLRRGDVIRVRVSKVAPEGGMPELMLEQDPLVQGALLAMETGSGHILTMMGGYDFATSQFNRAVQALRQPGSSFKPLIYAAGIESGMTPTTTVADNPITLVVGDKIWRPGNYDGTFLGPISLRTALTQSRNLATVDVIRRVGVKRVCAYARQLGIHSHLPCYPSLALGSASVTLLEMTAVYSVFANGGVYTEPVFITKIVDRYGQVLEEHLQRARRITSPEVAYTMTSLLESVVQQGTGRPVSSLERPTAGKTGTTNDFNDAWFIGYTPEIITGVWVGLDDHKPLGRRETGGRVAAPIWLAFMRQALEGRPRIDFPIPPGIRFVRANGRRGVPPTSWEPEAFSHFEVAIDKDYTMELPSPFNQVAIAHDTAGSRRGASALSTSAAPSPAADAASARPRTSRRELNRLDRQRRSE